MSGMNRRGFLASLIAVPVALVAVPGAARVFAPKGTDTVPAMLTPGEIVLTPDQVRRMLDLPPLSDRERVARIFNVPVNLL
jgi:hypothetical protein